MDQSLSTPQRVIVKIKIPAVDITYRQANKKMKSHTTVMVFTINGSVWPTGRQLNFQNVLIVNIFIKQLR